MDTLKGPITLLGDKLGPVLFQLPTHWNVNVKRLANFLDALPKGRRYAFEFRDDSWHVDGIYRLLEEARTGFCIHDHRDAPSPERVTAASVYVRFHGPTGEYAGKDTREHFRDWAGRIVRWEEAGTDVYAYYNNDLRGYAIENAQERRPYLAQ